MNTFSMEPPSITKRSLGLVILCKKHACVCGSGVRSRANIRGNPFYHQFLCVSNGKGGYTCGGQDLTGVPWGSPGKPSDDTGRLTRIRHANSKMIDSV